MSSIYEFSTKDIDGNDVSLSVYQGKVMLLVNVASKCGFTPQYTGLEAMYRKHRERGLVVLGFPCDQFGHQEPGDEDEIKNFCSLTYDVSFPMFAKVDVNGAKAHPLWQWLKSEKPGVLGLEAPCCADCRITGFPPPQMQRPSVILSTRLAPPPLSNVEFPVPCRGDCAAKHGCRHD